MEPILSNSNPLHQIRRIVFQIFMVLCVISIVGAAYFGFIHCIEIRGFIVNTFDRYEEVGSIDCVTFVFKKDQVDNGLFQKIEMETQGLRNRLGSPLDRKSVV